MTAHLAGLKFIPNHLPLICPKGKNSLYLCNFMQGLCKSMQGFSLGH